MCIERRILAVDISRRNAGVRSDRGHVNLNDGYSAEEDGRISPASTHSNTSDESFHLSRPTTPTLSSTSSSTSPDPWAESPLKLGCHSLARPKMVQPLGPGVVHGEHEGYEYGLPPPVVMFSLVPRFDFRFRDIVLANNVAWLDKSSVFSHLFSLQYSNQKVPIICRPSGFGKSFVVEMLETFHNVRTPDDLARGVFKDSAAGPLGCCDVLPINMACRSHLVLTFDLHDLDVQSPERWKMALHDTIDFALDCFMTRYQDLLDPEGWKRFTCDVYGSDGFYDLGKALKLWLTNAPLPVYLIVDDYDYPQRASNGDHAITHITLQDFVLPLQEIRRSLAMPSVFFGQENPSKLAARSGGWDIWSGIGVDCSGEFHIEATFGLTKAEIRELCRVLGVAGMERQIYETLLAQCGDLYDTPLYSTRDVMVFLAEQPDKRDMVVREKNDYPHYILRKHPAHDKPYSYGAAKAGATDLDNSSVIGKALLLSSAFLSFDTAKKELRLKVLAAELRCVLAFGNLTSLSPAATSIRVAVLEERNSLQISYRKLHQFQELLEAAPAWLREGCDASRAALSCYVLNL
ncbi:hypothetical protein BDZ89DRAFT_1037164 [Hymenopellis radicata]|nr:hypothetical protein BDZ89DRAFT_1037164 [Hymenopellis radicata]